MESKFLLDVLQNWEQNERESGFQMSFFVCHCKDLKGSGFSRAFEFLNRIEARKKMLSRGIFHIQLHKIQYYQFHSPVPLKEVVIILHQLERALNISDANYKNVRRAVSNYTNLGSRTKSQTLNRLKQMLQSKLPNTDIHKKFKEL